jgi:hypothetical protein
LDIALRLPALTIGVVLTFGDNDLELRLTAPCQDPNEWPTDAMRERIALCGGTLAAEPPGTADHQVWQLVARLPRGMQEALA